MKGVSFWCQNPGRRMTRGRSFTDGSLLNFRAICFWRVVNSDSWQSFVK